VNNRAVPWLRPRGRLPTSPSSQTGRDSDLGRMFKVSAFRHPPWKPEFRPARTDFMKSNVMAIVSVGSATVITC